MTLSDLGRMLSVDAIEDRFGTSKKVGYGEVSRFQHMCRAHDNLPYLDVEQPWSALAAGPISHLVRTQKPLDPLLLKGHHFWIYS